MFICFNISQIHTDDTDHHGQTQTLKLSIIMLIDTHAHLNFRAYKDDFGQVVKRCQEKKMSVINIGAQFSTSKRAADLALAYDFMYASVGLHPIHIFDEPFKEENYQGLINNKVVAIGETGLDFWHFKFLTEPFKIVLLHGWEGNKDERFFVWLDEQLTKHGHQVLRFNLPNTNFPKQEEWLKEISRQIGYVNQKTILVGFSLGGVAALRFLETLDEDAFLGAVYLLAAPINDLGYQPLTNFFQTDFNWPVINKLTDKKYVYCSTDDDVVPADHGKKLVDCLNTEATLINGVKHFTKETLPELLTSILKDIADLQKTLPLIDDQITKQQEVFVRHIELAKKNDLALICHGRNGLENREVYSEMLEILKKERIKRAVFHCYGSSLPVAQEIVKAGYYIGIDGPVTFKKKAEELQQIAKTIPLAKILIETDCPYLAPEPVRGQRNEPIYVEYVAEKIAQLRGLSTEEVVEQTWQNSKKLFRI